MNTPASFLPRATGAAQPVRRWFASIGRALAAAHREAYVSRHELDIRLLADINAPVVPPTPDEVRDAYRAWFGNDVIRRL
jgi:hypothetical protein